MAINEKQVAAAALVVSIAAASFSGGQWWEARRTRIEQAKSAAQADIEQRKMRQFSEAQVMASERGMILAERQLKGTMGKEVRDLPVVETDISRTIMPPQVALFGEPRPDYIQEFWENRDQRIRVRNTGGSTGYDLSCRFVGDVDSPGRSFRLTQLEPGSEPAMLMRDGELEIKIADGLDPRNPGSLEEFRKAVKDYFIIGVCSYRDAFERMSRVDACWEVRVGEDGFFKKRACKSDKEIDRDLQKKDEDDKHEGWQ